ncbi:MAG: hypothetical protein AB1641_17440, partial [Thermodesulfobacteriota bacterium]
ALNFRSMRYSILKAPPHLWLTLSVVLSVAAIGIVIQFDTIRDSFGIIMPKLEDLELILAFGVVVALSMEAIKFILRRKLPAVPGRTI